MIRILSSDWSCRTIDTGPRLSLLRVWQTDARLYYYNGQCTLVQYSVHSYCTVYTLTVQFDKQTPGFIITIGIVKKSRNIFWYFQTLTSNMLSFCFVYYLILIMRRRGLNGRGTDCARKFNFKPWWPHPIRALAVKLMAPTKLPFPLPKNLAWFSWFRSCYCIVFINFWRKMKFK